MFSSVEEDQRPHVIEHCYWPLLRLARRHNLPLGIEAPACTLEFIESIDPTWIAELRDLVLDGQCEFIGSGYAQLIGPLVPTAVNSANLRLGMDSYGSLLGIRPSIALVNEQAYSAGLVPLYCEAGYRALIMEWNNSARSHPDWDPEWRFYPQNAIGVDGSTIKLLWNKSIAFQKFQRYAHSDLELPELLAYLHSHVGNYPRCFPLYGNDAEVFDFRPGRFTNEAILQCGEWDRIEALVKALDADPVFTWISPSAVLEQIGSIHADHNLRLESSDQPIPVKKQDKYNVVRWALTGRDDLSINTRCHRLHQALSASLNASDADWKELCYLWSSDFRTHITPSRWGNYLQRLETFESQWIRSQEHLPTYSAPVQPECSKYTWNRNGYWLTVQTKHLRVCFNCRRGLAIDSFIDHRIAATPLFGTLHHGRFEDISWGADYYSGHLVFQPPGSHQITDLMAVEPEIIETGSGLRLKAIINTPLGPIIKSWYVDTVDNSLSLHLQLNWPQAGVGRLRFTPITLFPEAFATDTLVLEVTNGGNSPERFALAGQTVDHGKAVSFLVSAHQSLGLTDGKVQLGDANKAINLSFNPADAALQGQLIHQPVDDIWFTRFVFSARELDDTARQQGVRLDLRLAISSG